MKARIAAELEKAAADALARASERSKQSCRRRTGCACKRRCCRRACAGRESEDEGESRMRNVSSSGSDCDSDCSSDGGDFDEDAPKIAVRKV